MVQSKNDPALDCPDRATRTDTAGANHAILLRLAGSAPYTSGLQAVAAAEGQSDYFPAHAMIKF